VIFLAWSCITGGPEGTEVDLPGAIFPGLVNSDNFVYPSPRKRMACGSPCCRHPQSPHGQEVHGRWAGRHFGRAGKDLPRIG